MAVEGVPTTLVFDEEALIRLTENADRDIFADENARRFGFVKIRLDDSLQGKCSTGQDFLNLFNFMDLKKHIRKTCLYHGFGLGEQESLFAALPELLPQIGHAFAYINKLQEDSNFLNNINDESSTCCTDALRKGGIEGYQDHMLQFLKSHSKSLHRPVPTYGREERGTWTKKAKDSLKNLTPGEYSQSLTLAIESKEVREPITGVNSNCSCNSCYFKTRLTEGGNFEEEGLCYCANIPETPAKSLWLTPNYRMLFTTYANMLCDIPDYFLGVSCPAVYAGIAHSLFKFHIEDMSLWSFNFLLSGAPKYWIIIPPTHVRQINDVLGRVGLTIHRHCANRLMHKSYFFTVKFLEDHGIPHTTVIQKQGEGIILLPNCVHGGASLGPNLAQACNFGSKAWLPYGCQSLPCSCVGDMVHFNMGPLIQKYGNPGLMAAFHNGTVDKYMAHDNYFQQSSLFPIPQYLHQESGPGASQHQKSGPTMSSGLRTPRKQQVTCPLCSKSFKTDAKKAIRIHMNEKHNSSLRSKKVKQFLHSNGIFLVH